MSVSLRGAVGLGLVGWSLGAGAGSAQMVNRATITQVLDSNQVYIQNRLAKINDAATRGQQVRTGNARAQVTFNTGAVGRLAPHSVLTVGQCAQLQRGTLLVNGAMNGCTASVVAGVRGTTYVMQVDDQGVAEIKVLEGTVNVAPVMPEFDVDGLPVGTDGLDQTVTLHAGEKVAVNRRGVFGAIRKLTESDFLAVLRGNLVRGFQAQLPGIRKVERSFVNLYRDGDRNLYEAGQTIDRNLYEAGQAVDRNVREAGQTIQKLLPKMRF